MCIVERERSITFHCEHLFHNDGTLDTLSSIEQLRVYTF